MWRDLLGVAIQYISAAVVLTAPVAIVLLLADIALMAFTSWPGIPGKLIWGLSALIVVSLLLVDEFRVRFASRNAKPSQ